MQTAPTRFEDYHFGETELPFVLYPSLTRTPRTLSMQANWHEGAEIEWALEGEGNVRIGGQHFSFTRGDVVVIAPGEIHYTATEESLRYGCLILDPGFCRQIGISFASPAPGYRLRDERLLSLLTGLCDTVGNPDDPCRIAKSYRALLSAVICLREACPAAGEGSGWKGDRAAEHVKGAFRYLREHYTGQVSLDGIAGALFVGKYQLSREFRQYTGMTVFTYLERLRCSEAAALIRSGCRIEEAAERVGCRNPSFFTRVFKREFGCLPSDLKKEH